MVQDLTSCRRVFWYEWQAFQFRSQEKTFYVFASNSWNLALDSERSWRFDIICFPQQYKWTVSIHATHSQSRWKPLVTRIWIHRSFTTPNQLRRQLVTRMLALSLAIPLSKKILIHSKQRLPVGFPFAERDSRFVPFYLLLTPFLMVHTLNIWPYIPSPETRTHSDWITIIWVLQNRKALSPAICRTKQSVFHQSQIETEYTSQSTTNGPYESRSNGQISQRTDHPPNDRTVLAHCQPIFKSMGGSPTISEIQKRQTNGHWVVLQNGKELVRSAQNRIPLRDVLDTAI